MNKIQLEGRTLLVPVPVVMVSCEAPGFGNNIITLAWAGTICSEPPMLSISIRPERHSHAIISASREFVVNVPNRDLVRATDYCGVLSGRDVNKFKETGLTPLPGTKVKVPLIKEAPLNLECRVDQIIKLGTHDLFLAEILLVHHNPGIFDAKGHVDLQQMEAVAYGNGHYYEVAGRIGSHGFCRGRMSD